MKGPEQLTIMQAATISMILLVGAECPLFFISPKQYVSKVWNGSNMMVCLPHEPLVPTLRFAKFPDDQQICRKCHNFIFTKKVLIRKIIQ